MYIPVLLYVVIIYNQFFPIFYPVLQADLIRGYELDFLIDIGLSLLAGFLIGAERESRGKPAGISTHCFVIGGSMIFTYLSAHVDPNSSGLLSSYPELGSLVQVLF